VVPFFNVPSGDGSGGNSYRGTTYITVPFAATSQGSNVNTNVYCGNGGGGGIYGPAQSGGFSITNSRGGGPGGMTGGFGGFAYSTSPYLTNRSGKSATSGYTGTGNIGFYYGNGGGGSGNGAYEGGGNGSNGVVMIWASGISTITSSTCPVSSANAFISSTYVTTPSFSAVIFQYTGLPSTWNNIPPRTPGQCNITFINTTTIRYLLVGDGYGHRNSDCSIGLGHPDHDPGLERQ
jgi:hypothetical protein